MTKVLKGAGVDRTAVVKCNVFLANLPRDFAPMNEVYLEVSALSCLVSENYLLGVVSSTSLLIPRPVLALALRLSPLGLTWRLSVLRSFPELETEKEGITCILTRQRPPPWSSEQLDPRVM